LKQTQIPSADAAMNAVLTRNFTPCLRESRCEIAFVTKKSITWPFFMRVGGRPQFPVALVNHIIAQRTNVIVALSVDYGFGQRKMGLRNINAKGKQCEI
jgi:hypothetical protein